MKRGHQAKRPSITKSTPSTHHRKQERSLRAHVALKKGTSRPSDTFLARSLRAHKPSRRTRAPSTLGAQYLHQTSLYAIEARLKVTSSDRRRRPKAVPIRERRGFRAATRLTRIYTEYKQVSCIESDTEAGHELMKLPLHTAIFQLQAAIALFYVATTGIVLGARDVSNWAPVSVTTTTSSWSINFGEASK